MSDPAAKLDDAICQYLAPVAEEHRGTICFWCQIIWQPETMQIRSQSDSLQRVGEVVDAILNLQTAIDNLLRQSDLPEKGNLANASRALLERIGGRFPPAGYESGKDWGTTKLMQLRDFDLQNIAHHGWELTKEMPALQGRTRTDRQEIIRILFGIYLKARPPSNEPPVRRIRKGAGGPFLKFLKAIEPHLPPSFAFPSDDSRSAAVALTKGVLSAECRA